MCGENFTVANFSVINDAISARAFRNTRIQNTGGAIILAPQRSTNITHGLAGYATQGIAIAKLTLVNHAIATF